MRDNRKDGVVDVCLALGFFAFGFVVNEFFFHKQPSKTEPVTEAPKRTDIPEEAPVKLATGKKAQVDYRKLAHEYISSGQKAKDEQEKDEVPPEECEHPEDDAPIEEGEEEIVVYKIDPDKDYDDGYSMETVMWSLPDAKLFGENGEAIDRPELLIGDMVFTYEDYPSVYLRNEFLKTDFEVLISLDTYEGGSW